MQYSQILLALPLAGAIILDRRDPGQYAPAVVEEVVTVQATHVEVATEVVTVTVGPGGETPDVKAKVEDTNHGFQNAGDAPWAGRHRGGHHRVHQPKIEKVEPPPPVKEAKVEQPPPVIEEPKKETPKKETPEVPSSSEGGGGCPPDKSGGKTSPGVNGHGDRNMIDSINEIRRLYNPNAACLKWSPSLEEASLACTNIRSESALRANSGIVSDPGYETSGTPLPLAKTKFESSMYLMLCQAPGDPQMQGKCPFKTGEIGCSAGACTGHRDMIVDTKNEFRYMGAACDAGRQWMSASFSKTNEIFE